MTFRPEIAAEPCGMDLVFRRAPLAPAEPGALALEARIEYRADYALVLVTLHGLPIAAMDTAESIRPSH